MSKTLPRLCIFLRVWHTPAVMYRVMFICTGNICRSPLAHAVFEDIVRKNNFESSILVSSSGTDAWHVGEQADSRMMQTASQHGLEFQHYSQRLKASDITNCDLLLTMDSSNYRNTMVLARKPEERKKIQMFRDFDPQGSGDVPDPWYGNMDGFEIVWDMVERTCNKLFSELSSKLSTNS